jgi:hypothetical protein
MIDSQIVLYIGYIIIITLETVTPDSICPGLELGMLPVIVIALKFVHPNDLIL